MGLHKDLLKFVNFKQFLKKFWELGKNLLSNIFSKNPGNCVKIYYQTFFKKLSYKRYDPILTGMGIFSSTSVVLHRLNQFELLCVGVMPQNNVLR